MHARRPKSRCPSADKLGGAETAAAEAEVATAAELVEPAAVDAPTTVDGADGKLAAAES